MKYLSSLNNSSVFSRRSRDGTMKHRSVSCEGAPHAEYEGEAMEARRKRLAAVFRCPDRSLFV